MSTRFWYIQPDRIAGSSEYVNPKTEEAISYRVSPSIPNVDGLHAIQVYGTDVEVEWSDEYLRKIGDSKGEAGLPEGFLDAIRKDVDKQHLDHKAITELVNVAYAIGKQVYAVLEDGAEEFTDEQVYAAQEWADTSNLLDALKKQAGYPQTVQWPKPPEFLRGYITF